ncbi:MAG: GTPase HflX [Spirochaetaceae bacterium]|jgi:GTP-binding protein HflX|nr:GTPase HflX [Spirochaetaceae bacterium]
MTTVHETTPKPVRAFLAGVWDDVTSRPEAESLCGELAGLVRSLGHEAAGSEIVHLREARQGFGIGRGKAEEIAEKSAALGADCLILDWEVSPSQQKNWENLSGLSVLDRRELIIQIFASRARTREASLQVELAELTFSLPRLTHRYINLARQRGGSYGAKGSGETRFETDRRIVKNRIFKLEREIEQVRKQRAVQRKKRTNSGTPVCALVGYTNSGKSSLLNALTGADVVAEDKLFATLDTSSRRMTLCPKQEGAAVRGTADGALAQQPNEIGAPSQQPDESGAPAQEPDAGGALTRRRRECIVTDTVGFIRRLPHDLISAFRSTLEELSYAALLIHVLDASDPAAPEQYRTTLGVLADLGEDKKPMITALNKIDRSVSEETLAELAALCPNAVPISARTGEGLDGLRELIGGQLF